MPMSVDWQGVAICALALPPALGHVYHFVLIVNIASGLGYPEPFMDRFRSALFAVLIATSAFLLFGHLRDPWWNWAWPMRGYAFLCFFSGTVIAPLASLRLAMRQRPQGIRGRSNVHDVARGVHPGELIGTGRRASMLRLPGNESFRLHLREWEVEFGQIPEAFDGLQVVQLTDLHLAPCFERRFFEAVVDSCLGWQADLIVVTGDLVEDDSVVEWIEPLLSRLEARLGKFAVLGNHDRNHDPDHIVGELRRAGFETLDGEWTIVYRDGTTLALGLTSEPWGRPLPWKAMPPADFRILLSHSPDQFYAASDHGIDLALAGHNHGGQIRLPLIGPVFMPSRYSRRFDRGFFRHRQTLMYVSEGVAGKHPVRYGCPPEVTRFVLRSAVPEVTRDVAAVAVDAGRDRVSG
jgi:predicted MPP superfamily phosphohydrolase